MPQNYHIPLWKQVPVFRLLVPLIAGITAEWYLQFSLGWIVSAFIICIVCWLVLNMPATKFIFRFRSIRGFCFQSVMLVFGMLLTWQKDARHALSWYGHHITDSSLLLLQINEPLTNKPRSYKTIARVTAVFNGAERTPATGSILVYFARDTGSSFPAYGDMILVRNNLQAIRNSGNPGAFDYKRYAAFQLLYQQAYLKKNDWAPTGVYSGNIFQQNLFDSREYVLAVLRKYISNANHEHGIAEALLIGYKEDLDQELVRAYSNTGVVHIIAISGLHLGLIYTVLLWLLEHIPWIKRSRHIKAGLLGTCLWLFALLTGGSASVLRSAVMFTVIIAGKYYFRSSTVYNSLAASAFLLLCYNPYLLWDIGFQLSYCAVIGIVALQQFIYRKWYIPNFIPRQVWSMVSVTLAAQTGAFPLCVYYFHQFPNLFLLTNLIAVPLSTIILFGEILLVLAGTFHAFASWLGALISQAICVMNNIIIFCDSLAFSSWNHIYADEATTVLLYLFLFLVTRWWMNGGKKLLNASLLCLAFFCLIHLVAFLRIQGRNTIVIYNISRRTAIDFIEGDCVTFRGDPDLKRDGILQTFHLQPSRVALQAHKQSASLPGLLEENGYYQIYNKKLMVIDSLTRFTAGDSAIQVDIVLFSHNPAVDIKQLAAVISPACIVFDASNSMWKIQKWKRECDTLNLRSYSVAEEGAYILEVRSP